MAAFVYELVYQLTYELVKPQALKFGFFFVVAIDIPRIINAFRLENPQIQKLMVCEFKLKFEGKIKKITQEIYHIFKEFSAILPINFVLNLGGVRI